MALTQVRTHVSVCMWYQTSILTTLRLALQLLDDLVHVLSYRIKACALRFQHLFPATYGLLGGTPRLATRSPSGYLTTIRQLFDNYMTTYLTTYLTTAFPLVFRIHGTNFMRFPRMSLPLGTACAGNYKKQ